MLNHLTTEQHNPDSAAIDALSALDIVTLMNREDAQVAAAVQTQLPVIARAVDLIVGRLQRGGRLLYLGAGTSGRLGVLDAAECPPTFSTPPELVVGLIAGGSAALTRAVEGAEDRPEWARRDLEACAVSAADSVVGIATSGRTPFVLGGLAYARDCGAATIGLSCNADSALAAVAELMITPVVGPEVISGSTRLKAGTATKLVLNMLTTASMVRLGKTYGNLMVDLRATNTKLLDRARRIVALLGEISPEEAERVLAACAGDVKTAIVMQRRGVPVAQARQWLCEAQGHLRVALERPNAMADAAAAGWRDAPDRPGRPPAVAGRCTPRAAEITTLLLGVDGGGTKTTAILAEYAAGEPPRVLGRGTSGPSNPLVAGMHAAQTQIAAAVTAAFQAAGRPVAPVAALGLGAAGTGREPVRRAFVEWCEQSGLAVRCCVGHDAQLILRAAVSAGPGVALVSGTGSLAYGVDAAGQSARAGGWGALLGDEGSGYAIGREALRAVARAADGRIDPTELSALALDYFQVADARALSAAMADEPAWRQRVAALAELVVAAAERGDATALHIVDAAAADLAELVRAVLHPLQLSAASYPLALAGGVLRHASALRQRVLERLTQQHCAPSSVTVVDEPAFGAVLLAADLLA
jgi:N-acetylmuramic acid 6-phosphate etherase